MIFNVQYTIMYPINKISNDANALIDNQSKVIMFWTPRAACTASVSMFYKNMKIFDDVIKKHKWIHDHRPIFYKQFGRINNQLVADPQYFKFKMVRDPYKRAVSTYFVLVSNLHRGKVRFDISFMEYLKRIKNGFDFGPSINYHSIKQTSNWDKFMDKIVKIENVGLGLQEIDTKCKTQFKQSYDYITKSQNDHVRVKNTKINYFVGNMKASNIIKLSPDYVWFYNEKIRKLVEDIYGQDIVNYGYEYPF